MLTDDRLSTVRLFTCYSHPPFGPMTGVDIRTWHANIEQHASEGVNKILIWQQM